MARKATFRAGSMQRMPLRYARTPLLIFAAGLALANGACASTGSTPRPFPVPSASPSRPAADSPSAAPAGPVVEKPAASGERDDAYALVGTALQLRGVPYRNGGDTPSGFDCSGFTQYVFARHGVALPREVREQFRTGRTVTPQDVRPGDLIFFTTTAPGASHVGIAIGGDSFVHAPSSTGVVRVERLESKYWSPRLVGIRRLPLTQ
jgi:cell wall-associated NlpC family hydrolase